MSHDNAFQCSEYIGTRVSLVLNQNSILLSRRQSLEFYNNGSMPLLEHVLLARSNGGIFNGCGSLERQDLLRSQFKSNEVKVRRFVNWKGRETSCTLGKLLAIEEMLAAIK